MGVLWKPPDFSSRRQTRKLQVTIIKNPLGLLLPPLQTYSEPIPPAALHRLGHHKTFQLTLEFKLIFCTAVHVRKAHWGDHTHTLYQLSQGFPHLQPLQLAHHLTTHLCLLFNSADTLCAQQSSQGNAVGNILTFLTMVSNMQTQLQFLPCYHHTVLFQFWPPSFHWLETGWLSERGVGAKEKDQTHTFCPSRDQPLKKTPQDS